MRIEHKPDADKALEVLLYVAERAPNMYNALKAIYHADKLHLSRYGRLIYGDNYSAMQYGAVPSLAYDMARAGRGDNSFLTPQLVQAVRECLSVNRESHIISTSRGARPELLSESDIECLDEAIAECGSLSFDELLARSHEDAAFRAADETDTIPLQTIAENLPNAAAVLEYLKG